MSKSSQCVVYMVLPHSVERAIHATNKRHIASMSVVGNAARYSNSHRKNYCSFNYGKFTKMKQKTF